MENVHSPLTHPNYIITLSTWWWCSSPNMCSCLFPSSFVLCGSVWNSVEFFCCLIPKINSIWKWNVSVSSFGMIAFRLWTWIKSHLSYVVTRQDLKIGCYLMLPVLWLVCLPFSWYRFTGFTNSACCYLCS